MKATCLTCRKVYSVPMGYGRPMFPYCEACAEKQAKQVSRLLRGERQNEEVK